MWYTNPRTAFVIRSIEKIAVVTQTYLFEFMHKTECSQINYGASGLLDLQSMDNRVILTPTVGSKSLFEIVVLSLSRFKRRH